RDAGLRGGDLRVGQLAGEVAPVELERLAAVVRESVRLRGGVQQSRLGVERVRLLELADRYVPVLRLVRLERGVEVALRLRLELVLRARDSRCDEREEDQDGAEEHDYIDGGSAASGSNFAAFAGGWSCGFACIGGTSAGGLCGAISFGAGLSTTGFVAI